MGSRTAIILGASGGIGAALVKRLSQQGISVCLAGRNESDLELLKSNTPNSVTAIGDMTKSQHMEAAFRLAKETFGSLDIAVNCVGSIILKPAHLTSEQEFMETLEVNLLSAFLCVKHAVKAMEGGGRIVLVSSCAASVGLANHEAIAAAKAGVEGLTRSAAATYAPKKITVNCVAPGLVRTKLSEKITSNPKAQAFSLALHPLGRLGEADDVASAIHYLVSPDAGWITGNIMSVDGGLASIRG